MIIQVKDVAQSFWQGKKKIEVLKKVNLQIDKGESVAIVGPSGSGKTTLLSLLSGLDTPQEGEVTLLDRATHTLSDSELGSFRANHVGIVFQQFHLMPQMTALENVSLPLELANGKDAQNRARIELEKVGLSERLDHFPAQLSGGECQRVALARAMVINPQILFADEPSGNLDYQTGQNVMELLFQQIESRKMTLVLVTHDRELAKRCHRVLTMKDGQLS